MASDEAAAVDAVLEEKTVEDETPMAVTNVQTVELPSEITTSELPSDITTGELSSEVEIRTSELMSEITTADIPSEVTTDELPSVVITGELPTEVKTGELTAESTTGELPDEVTTGELPSEMTTGELPSEVTTGEVQSEVEVTTGELMSEITTLEIPSVSEDLTIEDVGEGEEGGEAADGGEEGEWGEVEDGYEEGEDEEEGYEVREEGEEAEEREEAEEGEGYEGREEEEDEWDEGEDEEDIEEAVESQESDKSVKSKLSVSRSTEGETTETRLTTEGEDEEEELGEEEEEEEELTEEDEELKRLREYHTVILEQHKLLKIKNICLKKKLTKTFKKKKIDYALSEIKGTRDLQKRYRQKLLEFDEEEQIMMETMELIATKWELIREQTLLERVQLDEALEDLYERQRQIGANLIDVKTGKPINKKIVEDLIVQQTNLAAHMSQVRLCNIKLKNSVANKKAEIKLDHLGTDFHLMDYEQLCKDKEDYSDKIISRDMELKEVNQKAKEMKDFVDQVKTVSDNVQSMTDSQFYTLEQLDQKLIEARENINSLKERRHYTLEEIDRIKNNSGLLTHPDLLYDFEDTSKAVVEAKIQLETLRNISKNQKSNSRRLRKIVEKKKGRFSVIKAKEY